MSLDQLKASLRHLDSTAYPELIGLSQADIYHEKMGPGGLYLACRMSRRLGLRPGQVVLDLGCGKGETSIFLHTHYSVRVFAVDLWIGATYLSEKFQKRSVAQEVIPLNLDVSQKLPFAEGYFDAIFCMDSIHYYGGTVAFMQHLLPHLKPGGMLCLGSPCFNEEFTPEALQKLPLEYDDGTNLWPKEFSRYHSPPWWAALLEETEMVEQVKSGELAEGVVLWEDDLLFNIEHLAYSEKQASTDHAQITYGHRHHHRPYLTHFILTARKKQFPNNAPTG
jgi:SAM-dependent methyltransferase